MKISKIQGYPGLRSVKITINFTLDTDDQDDIPRAIEKLDAGDIKQAILTLMDTIDFSDDEHLHEAEAEAEDGEDAPTVAKESIFDRAMRAGREPSAAREPEPIASNKPAKPKGKNHVTALLEFCDEYQKQQLDSDAKKKDLPT